MKRFSPETEADLLSAGWHIGRAATDAFQRWRDELTHGGVAIFAAAEAVLTEFGGLEIGDGGAGEEAARMVVTIDASGFVESESSKRWIRRIARACREDVCPIGSVDEEHALLFITESGRVVMVMDPLFWEFGAPFDAALERLLRGRKSRGGGRLDSQSLN